MILEIPECATQPVSHRPDDREPVAGRRDGRGDAARGRLARSPAIPARRNGFAFVVAVCLTGLVPSAMAHPIDILQPWPASPEGMAMGAGGAAAGLAGAEREPYVVRTGIVRLDADALMPISPSTGLRTPAPGGFRGRSLGMGFFDDARFEVLVEAASRPADDTLALGGKPADQPVSTFTLTSNPESYLMTLQDIPRARLYRVVGDTGTGTGRVTEIDLTKMPPALCSPPLVPPVQ